MQATSEIPSVPLYIAQSTFNKKLLSLYLLATFVVACFFDPFFIGGFGTFTLICILVTIWQVLRTYVVRTTFAADHVEHRDHLGRESVLPYTNIMVQEDNGDSITIFGDDVVGRNIRFRIEKRDGNLESIVSLLKSRIPREEA